MKKSGSISPIVARRYLTVRHQWIVSYAQGYHVRKSAHNIVPSARSSRVDTCSGDKSLIYFGSLG